MPHEWPLDPQELFIERYPQMLRDLPSTDVDSVRISVT
jgi:esterase FrsA